MTAIVSKELTQLMMQRLAAAVHSHCRPFSSCSCPISVPSMPQHPSYGDCLEFTREYYQNSSVLDCVTMFTVCSTFM